MSGRMRIIAGCLVLVGTAGVVTVVLCRDTTPPAARVYRTAMTEGFAPLLGSPANVGPASEGAEKLVARSVEPADIMGTLTRLTVVFPADRAGLADPALRAAEAALREVESQMSSYLSDSEVSRLNAAGAGAFGLSPPVREVLAAARGFASQTEGAFDVTCRPILRLWRRAGKSRRLPDRVELAEARQSSNWELLELTEAGAVKRKASVEVDLGGIAKGYAIDRAVAAMVAAGASGGLVDVGGDLRCFGRTAQRQRWRIAVRDPSHPLDGENMRVIELTDRAVCTSGNYFRFVEIGGRRYSHIVDPRTAMPADAVPSSTVVARTAMTADAWATALSVLGSAGLKHLPKDAGIEAMIIVPAPAAAEGD